MRPIRVEVNSPYSMRMLTKVNLPPGGDSAKRGTRMLVKVEFDVPYFVPPPKSNKNGRIVSNPFVRALRLRAAESRICSGR